MQEEFNGEVQIFIEGIKAEVDLTKSLEFESDVLKSDRIFKTETKEIKLKIKTPEIILYKLTGSLKAFYKKSCLNNRYGIQSEYKF